MVSLLLFDRYIVTHLPSRRNSAILTNNWNQYGCRLYASFRLWNLDDLCQWIISHWFIVEKELSVYFCGSRNFHRKQMPSILCWKAHFTNSSSFFFFFTFFSFAFILWKKFLNMNLVSRETQNSRCNRSVKIFLFLSPSFSRFFLFLKLECDWI